VPAVPAQVAPATTAAPATVVPGYEVAGVPAGWIRHAEIEEGRSYVIRYTEPVSEADPVARVEAEGRRISLLVSVDPNGTNLTMADSYPGHPATLSGMPARVFETAPPPGGRRGVEWNANGLHFAVIAYMDEPALLRLAGTVRATGGQVKR
jgi:hypothetical protein